MSSDRIRRDVVTGVWLCVVFVAYVTTARIGLTFDALAGIATTVWPPAGIALATLVLGGIRMWPVITLAALVVNISTGIPPWSAMVIAIGNTWEAIAGAWLLGRFGFDTRLARLRDVLLLGAAAVCSTTLAASFGLAASLLAGLRLPDGPTSFWAVWWVGDAMGVLLIGGLICAWATGGRASRNPWRWLEALLLAGAFWFVSMVVFRRLLDLPAIELVPGTFTMVPLLIWAALSFEQRGVTAALLLVAAMAVTAPLSGAGVATPRTPHQHLFLLQAYMAVTTVSMLILAAALAERKAAIGARDEFISIASHELKTPLTALKLRLDAATRPVIAGAAVGVDLNEKRLRALVAANTTTDRLVTLVDNLLDVSRLHAGGLVLQLEPVSMEEVVHEVAGRLREQAAESGSTIEVHIPERVVGIWDRTRMEQVVTNLLTNAIKYGRGKPIRISARTANGRLQLRVRDAGIGISRLNQSRIFHAFERVVTANRVGGLGLGLYIGQQIAAAHHGTLLVDSEPDRGTTFTLDMPMGPTFRSEP
jgi:signal transduction histidine kinase